jgi:hypothetical protein
MRAVLRVTLKNNMRSEDIQGQVEAGNVVEELRI